MKEQTVLPVFQNDDVFLTPHEVAAYLRVPRTTLYEWLSCGIIPSLRLGKRIIRIRKSDLDAFVASGGSRGNGQA